MKAKKNLIAVVVCAIIVIACVAVVVWKLKGTPESNSGVDNNQQDTPKVEEKAEEIIVNEKYDVSEGRKNTINNTRLNGTDVVTAKEGKIDFSDLPGVTYEYIGEDREESFTEVWIVKLSEVSQYDKIVNKLKNRLEELKEQYKDDPAATSILNDKDNIKIEYSNGVVIAVFAPDAGALISEAKMTTYDLPSLPEEDNSQSTEGQARADGATVQEETEPVVE